MGEVERDWDEQLIKASDHLHYETWMLRLTAFQVTGLPTGPSSPVEDADDELSGLRTHTHTSHVDVSVYSSEAPYTPPSVSEEEAVLGNATLEAFAIHIRSLLDFFYLDREKAKPDDVLAEHYFSEPGDWIRDRPELSKSKIKEIKTRVAKEVAHLTYERNRIAEIEWDWPILEYKSVILDALEVFLQNVDNANLSDRWKS